MCENRVAFAEGLVKHTAALVLAYDNYVNYVYESPDGCKWAKAGVLLTGGKAGMDATFKVSEACDEYCETHGLPRLLILDPTMIALKNKVQKQSETPPSARVQEVIELENEIHAKMAADRLRQKGGNEALEQLVETLMQRF